MLPVTKRLLDQVNNFLFWEETHFDISNRLNFLIDDVYEFEMVACLLTDLFENWTELNLHTRQSLSDFVKSVLTALYETENFQLNSSPLFKPIMSGFLFAAGKVNHCLNNQSSDNFNRS